MADGREDLRGKNGEPALFSGQYAAWRVFQGREDAELLQEKSAGRAAARPSREGFDAWEED